MGMTWANFHLYNAVLLKMVQQHAEVGAHFIIKRLLDMTSDDDSQDLPFKSSLSSLRPFDVRLSHCTSRIGPVLNEVGIIHTGAIGAVHFS
jgi:hypothetical protein